MGWGKIIGAHQELTGRDMQVASPHQEQRDKVPISISAIRSPKQKRVPGSRANWFPYYAGFSVGFVEDIISYLDLGDGATLLDPWLGAGTTSEVATANGYRIRGYDLNPAMLVVARARTIPTCAAEQIPALTKNISRCFERGSKNNSKAWCPEDDPLEQWLQPASAAAFRILEQSVESSILEREGPSRTPLWRRAGQASPVLSLFYVGLFRSLRHFISEFQSSNPTWVKVSAGKKRIQLSSDRILGRFYKEIESLLGAIKSETEAMPSVGTKMCLINQASSLRLPIRSGSIDAVVSSPPYCTRIDYVRATLPELAVIGHPNGQVTRGLRDMMIGTPTISKMRYSGGVAWGPTCSRFLSAVQNHSSKASSTYYLRYYRQYFASVFSSLNEIDRVLKRGGQCVLVVQDSYYKEIKNNLPRVFIEMATLIGWTLEAKKPFRVNQTLAGVNPDVKAYRTTFHATEWFLVFSK